MDLNNFSLIILQRLLQILDGSSKCFVLLHQLKSLILDTIKTLLVMIQSFLESLNLSVGILAKPNYSIIRLHACGKLNLGSHFFKHLLMNFLRHVFLLNSVLQSHELFFVSFLTSSEFYLKFLKCLLFNGVDALG